MPSNITLIEKCAIRPDKDHAIAEIVDIIIKNKEDIRFDEYHNEIYVYNIATFTWKHDVAADSIFITMYYLFKERKKFWLNKSYKENNKCYLDLSTKLNNIAHDFLQYTYRKKILNIVRK